MRLVVFLDYMPADMTYKETIEIMAKHPFFKAATIDTFPSVKMVEERITWVVAMNTQMKIAQRATVHWGDNSVHINYDDLSDRLLNEILFKMSEAAIGNWIKAINRLENND